MTMATDWQVITKTTNEPARPLISWLMRLLLVVPEPPAHSSVMWTIRHVRTGEIQKITAHSEEEFAARLEVGAFD
jgi:hypothetical protein